MKNIINASLALMLATFVFSQGVLGDYDIPEYEYRTFMLSGDELFNSLSDGTNTNTSMNFGADYMSKSQSPGYNLSYGLGFNYDSESYSNSDNSDADWDESNWTMDAPFAVDKYFGDTKGMFGFADGTFSTWGGDDVPDGQDDTSDLHLTVGAGFGRVISAKPVAQAYAIADALGIDASDDTILAIAEVIGAADSYGSIYKDNATEQYYNDLAEAAGSEGSAMQIQKVLTSPAYNVSDRFTGWDVRAGLTNNYMQDTPDGVDPDAGWFALQANYALPMDADGQLMVSFDYMMDMNSAENGAQNWSSGLISKAFEMFPELGGGDDYYYDYYYDYDYYYGGSSYDGGATTMDLGVSYTLDHSYNWSTSANFNYISDSYSVTSGETTVDLSDSGMFLSLSTTKAILNQMSVTASFDYLSIGGDSWETDPDPVSKISTKLTYWVF